MIWTGRQTETGAGRRSGPEALEPEVQESDPQRPPVVVNPSRAITAPAASCLTWTPAAVTTPSPTREVRTKSLAQTRYPRATWANRAACLSHAAVVIVVVDMIPPSPQEKKGNDSYPHSSSCDQTVTTQRAAWTLTSALVWHVPFVQDMREHPLYLCCHEEVTT